MSDISIALTGLNVALRAIEVAGNNIANASTDGYHRQEVKIVPIPSGQSGELQIGGGADVGEVRRIIDRVLEGEILRQQPLSGRISQELDVLRSIESILGDIETEGLGKALSDFFNALRELAADPSGAAMRDQVVSAADALAGQFRHLAGLLEGVETNIDAEARNVIDQVNTLSAEIADLNARLGELYYRGLKDNNLLDRRDEAVRQLAGLVDMEVADGVAGSYLIRTGGTAIVVRSEYTPLEVGMTASGDLGVSVQGAGYYDTQITGGRLGGLLSLRNELIPTVHDALDTLAAEIILQVNRLHVQGVGTDGSFTRLDGIQVPARLSEWSFPPQAGQVAIRITNTATGDVRREYVTVDPADTLSDVAARFDALDGLSAGVVDRRLHLEADAGYRFDFLPAILQTPATSNLTGTAVPSFSGVYTGEANQTFTFRVVGFGLVGVTDGLALEVTNEAGETVTRINVGLGYAAGDAVEVTDGVRVALSPGLLNDGETFTVDAIAESDTSGLLAAAGVNTLFSGEGASTIALAADVRESRGRLATAARPGGNDNILARRMAALADRPLEALGGVTMSDYYRSIVSGVGQSVAARAARQKGYDAAASQLAIRRDSFSGVDLNEEAARLMVYEQLFQGMAKYLSIVEEVRKMLFEVL